MSVAPFQPLDVADFSGGRTDNYLSGATNKFRRADNFVVVKHGEVGKLLSRFGSELYDVSAPLVNPAIERLGVIRNFKTTTDQKVLVQSNRKMFSKIAGAWTELVGPVTSNSLFPAGTTTANVTSFAEWNDHMFVTNDAFAAPSKIYNDASGVLKLRTAGLPRLASSPTVTAGAAGAQNFIYRFVNKYTYVVNTVTFVDRSDFTEVVLTNSAAPNVNPVSITAIPVLANGATFNWETTATKVEIYRTINNGTVFHRLGEVTNGTTTFTDNISDATAQTNELLYTEGGVVPNDPTPLAKLVHITGDIAYWAHIKTGTQILSNRLVQAIPGDPDSVPEDFFVDVQDEIVGLSSTRGLPILLCKNSVYRVDGQFDELGRGGMTAQKISDTATCVSSQSVVQTIEGVFWAGEDSYYFTDGYEVIKLCEDWIDSYKNSVQTDTQKKRLQGKYDKRTRRIWWTIQTGTGLSNDCNACDILHLDWGIKRDACFTSASGGNEFAPTAIEFIDGDMLRGDIHGYLLIHSDDLTSDPKIDVLVAPASWSTKTVIWDYVSCALSFGTSFLRKYADRLVVTLRNKSNLSLQIISINDDGRKIANLKPIRFRGNIVWGDSSILWGDAGVIWSFDGLIEDRRMFPSNSLRFSYKQIELTNADIVITSSDVLGTGTVNNTTKIVTLDNAASVDWPSDPIDYTISFDTDNYNRQYTITARTADTITFLDIGNHAPSGAGIKWEIFGTPKGEVMNLLSYTISFILMGKTQQFFTPSESGEVGS